MTKALDSGNPWLFVYDTIPASTLVIGQEVDHVGKATGWQHGWVSATCNDYADPDNSSLHIYCAGEAGFIAENGDSGGPVFFFDGYVGAALVGTVNALDCGPRNEYCGSGQGSRVLFSTWSGILADLGALNPLIGTTVGTPSLSGSVSDGQGTASWSAVSTTNTSATTQYQIWEWTWDASTGAWVENEAYSGATTGLFYTDASAPWTISSVAGGSMPDQCQYSSVGIEIRAYNQGVYAYSNQIWFRGPANGPGRGAC